MLQTFWRRCLRGLCSGLALAAGTLAVPALAGPVGAAAPLLIAVEDDWPPFAVAEGRGEARMARGLAVDLVRAAFASQGVEVSFVPVPFARCMAMARTPQVLGCFIATQTVENRPQYLWHEPPLFMEELAIYGLGPAPTRSLGATDLRGKQVGLTNGYTYPTAVMRDPEIRRQTAVSDGALLRMLVAKRVDYVLMNATPAQQRIQEDATLSAAGIVRVGRVSLDGFWLAFSLAHPQSQDMATRLGAGLVQLRRSGRYPARLQAP